MFAAPRILAVLALLAGCERPEARPEPPPVPHRTATAPASPSESPPATPLEQESLERDVKLPPRPPAPTILKVVCTPAVTEAVTELGRRYEETTGVRVRVQSIHPGRPLQSQVGPRADILIPEGYGALLHAQAAGLVAPQTGQTVVFLPLTVTTTVDKAEHITSLADLRGAGFRVGLSEPGQSSATHAANRLLQRAQLVGQVTTRILPTNALEALKNGTVDVLVRWGRPNFGVPVPIPRSWQEYLPVPGVVTTQTRAPEEAKRFLEQLRLALSQSVWSRTGAYVRLPDTGRITMTTLPVRLPSPRQHAGSVRVDDRILLIGGELGGTLLTSLTWIMPSQSRVWDDAIELPSGRTGVSVDWPPTGSAVWILGGRTDTGPSKDILRFQLRPRQISPHPLSLPSPMHHAAIVRQNNRLFLFGGVGEQDALLDRIVCLEEEPPAIRTLDVRLPTPLARSVATLRSESIIWILGGVTPQGPTDRIVAFDPEKETLQTLSLRLPTPLADATLAQQNNVTHLFGGRAAQNGLDSVLRLNPDETMQRLPFHLPTATTGASSVTLGEHTYVLGGVSKNRVESRILRFPF